MMATVIKTLNDAKTGDVVAPRTVTRAVSTEDGISIDEKLTALDEAIMRAQDTADNARTAADETAAAGLMDWKSTETYAKDALVKSGGRIYCSLQAGNLNHAVSSGAWWIEYGANNVISGAEATPTDDKNVWLRCVNYNYYVENSSKTLAQIAASQSMMNTLANSANASDYMIRSTGAIMAAVTGSATAMTEIGKSSYATDALIKSSAWTSAVAASANAVTGLDASSPVTVPTMTSYTAPSGTASASSEYSGSSNNSNAWKAFSTSTASGWGAAEGVKSAWLQYEFSYPVWPYKFTALNETGTQTYKIQASADGASFTDLTDTLSLSGTGASAVISDKIKNNAGRFKCYRLQVLSTTGTRVIIISFQIYGK